MRRNERYVWLRRQQRWQRARWEDLSDSEQAQYRRQQGLIPRLRWTRPGEKMARVLTLGDTFRR